MHSVKKNLHSTVGITHGKTSNHSVSMFEIATTDFGREKGRATSVHVDSLLVYAEMTLITP